MRLLLVTRSLPLHRHGGMEEHTRIVAQGLARRGHDVEIVTTSLPPGVSADAIPGVRLTPLPGSPPGRYAIGFLRALVHYCRRPDVAARIDMVHAQGFAGVPLVLARDMPRLIVTTIHGTLFSETPLHHSLFGMLAPHQKIAALWQYKHRLVAWPAWRSFLRRNPALVVDSDYTRRELLRANPRLDPRVVPLGLDLDEFRALDMRPEYDPQRMELADARAGDTARPRLLVAAGRLETAKGFRDILPILAQLPADAPTHLVIVGDGALRARLANQIRQVPAPHRVRLTGRLERADVLRWMAAADAVLVPDRAHPAFGLAPAEALLLGTRVLATDNGAHPEVIASPDDGVLLPARETEAWVEALGTLAPDTPDARTARRERALVRFDAGRMIADLERVYEGLASARA